MHKTIHDKDFKIIDEDSDYNYQLNLTEKLDAYHSDFDQNTLNEIVLWKVNRYAKFSKEIISVLNSIRKDDTVIDEEKTCNLLMLLLNTKGVQLAMASTILRFKNPKIYQIIDQRVYRILNPENELKIATYTSQKNIEFQIKLYLKYLVDLRKVCGDLNIPFEQADRILYNADRRINKEYKLKNY